MALAGMSFAALMLLAATDAPAGGPPADDAAAPTPSGEVATVAKVYTPRLVLRAATVVAPPGTADDLESSACETLRVGLGASGSRADVAGT